MSQIIKKTVKSKKCDKIQKQTNTAVTKQKTNTNKICKKSYIIHF